MPSRSSTKSVPYGKSKIVGSEQTAALSASASVPAVLANPLSLRAAVLRKPQLSEELTPELVEEGDILFNVLANPLHCPSVLFAEDNEIRRRSEAAAFLLPGVGFALSFPSSVGKHFVGQQFRAFLSFYNAATYSLCSLRFFVECFNPTLQRATLVNSESLSLDGKGNASFTVEVLLQEPGQHTLNVMVTYLDIVNETKQLTWSSSFQVERAVTELYRSLNVVHVPPSNRDEVLSQLHTVGDFAYRDKMFGAVLPKRKYVLSICLQNTSSMSLVILSVRLRNGDAFECLPCSGGTVRHNSELPPPWWPRGTQASERGSEFLSMSHNGGSTDALEDIHLQPRDKRCYYFEFAMKTDVLRSIASCRGVSSGSSAVTLSSLIDIGHVEWEWQSANGDSGAESSGPLQLCGFFHQPMLELFVANVQPKTPKAGDPVTVECVAVNYDMKNSIDLVLRVRPELLAPAFVYAGPLMRPLGSVEPLGTLAFVVSLVPWQPGWSVLRGGLELCDARAPTTLLWPLPPGETQPLPSTSTHILVPNDVAEGSYPPVLCEILVY